MRQKHTKTSVVKFLAHQRIVMFFAVVLFVGLTFFFNKDSSINWFEFWWMLPISFTIALTVNTVGISGAALFVPFFIIIFPHISNFEIQPSQSVHLALITESFGLTSSALAFANFGLIDFVLGAKTVLTALPLLILGVVLSFIVPDTALYILISIVLAVAVVLMLQSQKSHKTHKKFKTKSQAKVNKVDATGAKYSYTRTVYKYRFLGYGVGGLFQGLAGFGIGELGLVSMLKTNIPIRIAIGTNHMIVSLTAAVASILHVIQSTQNGIGIPWNIVIMTVPGVVIGGQLAPHVAAKLPVKTLKYTVAAIFVILSVTLFSIGLNTF